MVAKQLKEATAELTKEHLQQQLEWQGERALLEQQLKACREKVRLILVGISTSLGMASLHPAAKGDILYQGNIWVNIY